MKRYKLSILVTSLLLFMAALCACSAQPWEGEVSLSTVRVIATQNFGQELLFDQLVELRDGTSALDALKQVAQIETAYGGGFVNAINGVRSGFTGSQRIKTDWFIYVNGIQSNIGALDYKLHGGDIQHWDFHDWSFHHFIPAIVGDFPEPFRHGYGGKTSKTLIVCSDSIGEDAEYLKSRLVQLGVSDVGIRRFGELLDSEKESCNLLLIGAGNSDLISELNQTWRRLGFFAYIENGNIVTLNAKGEIAARYGAGVGLIQATQNPWNPSGIGAGENMVWMVSGIDEAGVKNAIDTLINHYTEFQYAYAAIVADGKIIKVPSVKL